MWLVSWGGLELCPGSHGSSHSTLGFLESKHIPYPREREDTGSTAGSSAMAPCISAFSWPGCVAACTHGCADALCAPGSTRPLSCVLSPHHCPSLAVLTSLLGFKSLLGKLPVHSSFRLSLNSQHLVQQKLNSHCVFICPMPASPAMLCRRCLQQRPASSLPTASIILTFHDEAWSTLLRTVHSILDTAPRPLLQEILLVDDLSQQGQLKSALSEYVARLEAVKLLRSNKRLGTIGAQMLGATRASGDVLVFMDAHCECHPGWLEPLLSRIADDRSRVVSPVIDVIDWKTLQYSPSTELQRGVLDWKLDFHWEPLPEQEWKARPSPISPVRSPVVPGEVVAMDRHFFQNTGAYDSLLSLRGGENLELSLKVWLCGGTVEILPCSRVGHIYRSQDTSSLSDLEAALLNKVRIAETWLGSFKETFYKHNPEAFALSKAAKPDCTERLQLQRRLGCRTFHWFLANVYPELYPSEHRPRFSGKLHNTGLGFCADCQREGAILGCPVTLAPCSNGRQQQYLEHTSRKEIRFGSPQPLCFDVRREQVILQNCTEEGLAISQQHWDFQEDGMIVHFLSGQCIEAVVQQNNKDLYLRQCDGKASQLWHFDQVRPVDER